MTTRLTTTVAAVSTAALLSLGLAACSSESSIEEFCKSGQSDLDSALEDADVENPDAMVKAMTETNDRIQKIKAPAEIAEDWGVLQDAYGKFSEALKDVDTSDDDTFADGLMDAYDVLGSDEVQTANSNLNTFVEENCEA